MCISFCIPMKISSPIFLGTGCTSKGYSSQNWAKFFGFVYGALVSSMHVVRTHIHVVKTHIHVVRTHILKSVYRCLSILMLLTPLAEVTP